MVRPLLRVAFIAVAALLVLGAGSAEAFNPQPDPPGFGMFGIMPFQRAHLHISLPVMKMRGGIPADPCRVEASFVNDKGETVMTETHTIWPGQTGNLIFTPARVPDPEITASVTEGNSAADRRMQLRAVVMALDSTLPPGPCHDLLATVQVDNQQGGAPTLTLSPRDPASGLPTGKRSVTHLLGALAIGFEHTARLNAVNTGDVVCHLDWTFVDETGVRKGDSTMILPGQAVHADFAHTDPTRGVALIRAEATTSGCPADATIGTLEGFDSNIGHSHSIVGAQLIVAPAQ
jgi:hypothetical protein